MYKTELIEEITVENVTDKINKKISEIVGDRLARKRHFPPC